MNTNFCVDLESLGCPLGCAAGDEIVLTGYDRLNNLPGEFDVVKCSTCGLMRTNPRPKPGSMGFYYPNGYGPYQSTRINNEKLSNIPISKWKRILLNMFQDNSKSLPSIPVGRMLEVGCASGSFLHKMNNEGWDVEGIEFSKKAVESARLLGYRIHAGSLETAPEPKKLYDLVVGWMVLEHLHDPILALQKLRRWTKSGGWLVVSMPNADTMEFRIFGDAWYGLHLPNHLYHFTPRTFKMVLERCGWQVQKIFHQRTLNNLIASLGYVLQDKGYIPQLANSLIAYPERAGRITFFLYPLACLLAAFGQTGRMTVWARKING